MPEITFKYRPYYAPEDREFMYENGIAGFLLGMFLDGKQIGQFHSYLVLDDDSLGLESGQMNDADIKPKYRRQGYGKLLLLTSIELSHDLLNMFYSDSRDLSRAQEGVYGSLSDKNLIDCVSIGGRMHTGMPCKLTDEGRRYLEQGMGLEDGALNSRPFMDYIKRSNNIKYLNTPMVAQLQLEM